MKHKDRKYILKNADTKSAKEISRELGLKERTVRKLLEGREENKTPKSNPERSKAQADKSKIWMSVALIVVLGFAVYISSLSGEFLWDDEYLIVKNENIRSFSNLGHVFLRTATQAFQRDYGFYRPMQEFTYMIDFALWKLNSAGYHLTNVLIHICVALAVFWLINILYDNWRLSLLTSLFYVAFPLHTEAVGYIAGRADSLVALFMLLCFIFYIKNCSGAKISHFALMILSYICALLSRENSMVFPALLLAYHFSFKKKINVKAFSSILVVLGVYMLIRLTVLKHLMVTSVYTTTLLQRLPGVFSAIASYLRLLLLPLDLHMAYGNKTVPLTDARVWAGIVILCVTFFFMLRSLKRRRWIFFSLSWFFIFLFPHANIFPINAYMYEHWLYFPSIGLFVILANGLIHLRNVEKFKEITNIFIIGFLLFYSYLTIQQNITWTDPLAFYERTLQYVPDNSEVNNNIGIMYNDAGRKEEAIIRFEKAIKSNPKYAEAYNNLGNVYKDTGRGEEAVRMFEKAIEIDPFYPEAHANLGVTYFTMDKKEKAISLLKKSIELNPGLVEGYNNLAAVYFYQQEYESAIKYYDKSKELGFQNPALSKLLEPYR